MGACASVCVCVRVTHVGSVWVLQPFLQVTVTSGDDVSRCVTIPNARARARGGHGLSPARVLCGCGFAEEHRVRLAARPLQKGAWTRHAVDWTVLEQAELGLGFAVEDE